MRRVASAVLVATLVAITGCTSTSSHDGRIGVVAGFYPLQFVAEKVGGDRVAVTNLVQPGAEPHDLELTPRQVATIVDAKLVLYLHGFQPAVDEAVTQNSAPAIDAATLVPLLAAPAPIGPKDPTAEQVATGGQDPHIWLDPSRLATIASAVGQRLAEVDPGGADGYRERAQQLSQQLGELDQDFADGLRQCQRHEIVVSHAAFGYLADRFGLRQIPITGLAPETEPTPQHLAAAADEARRVGATTIFFETLVSPKVADAVATAAGARTAVLDPIEGLEPGNPGDYVSVMRANLATLRAALGCT
jgi:zinc transport system substrate-binding protein